MSAFTMVEILVVITILALMVGGVTLAYIASQKQASTASGLAIARSVASAAERYYSQNGRYPSSSEIAGSNRDLTDAEFTTAAAVLGVKASSIKGVNNREFRLSPCNQLTNTTCSYDNISDTLPYVYYATRANNGTSDAIVSSLQGPCSVTIAADDGSSAFFIAFYSPSDKDWVLLRSSKGRVSASGGCKFS